MGYSEAGKTRPTLYYYRKLTSDILFLNLIIKVDLAFLVHHSFWGLLRILFSTNWLTLKQLRYVIKLTTRLSDTTCSGVSKCDITCGNLTPTLLAKLPENRIWAPDKLSVSRVLRMEDTRRQAWTMGAFITNTVMDILAVVMFQE